MPFRIGDHEFLELGVPAPLSRTSKRNRKPIANAEPPPFLAGCVREPATTDAAKVLVHGTFCGHGEPTYTVFDIVIDGQERLDVVTFFVDDDEDEETDAEAEDMDDEDSNAAIVLARPVGTDGPWLVIFSHEWMDEYGNLQAPDEPHWHEFDDDEKEEVAETAQASTLAIGFEYPPDADSLNGFSWLAIDAWPDDNEDDPYVIVSIETA